MSDNAFTPVDLDSINLTAPAFVEITPEQLEAIQNAPPPRRGSKSKQERLWGERILKNWWDIPTHSDTCTYCDHKHMCANMPGVDQEDVICRRCYLVSNDKLPVDERITHEPPADKS